MKKKLGIDAHCHLEYIENSIDVAEEVRERMTAAVCSVPDPKDVDKMLALREQFSDCIFLCLGFHPEVAFNYTEKQRDDYIEKIRQNSGNIAAIGEIGLDYNWITDLEKQKETEYIFAQFIHLANDVGKPIVIHARNHQDKKKDAFQDCLDMLAANDARRVVMHCFSGNEKTLQQAIDQNYWISFATIIARSDKHKRLAEKTPLDRVLLETDSPWLDPDSRELTNRPWKIERSAEIIAQLTGKTKEEIMKITTKNAIKAFDLDL